MIPFVITNAGLTALANVSSLGPVNLATIKIGSGGVTPTPSVTALQTVISTLTPIGSSVPATGVVHMTFEDAGASSYSVTEIGIFTSGGVLFAYYSASTPFLVKTGGNIALFSIDLFVTNASPGSLTTPSASFNLPPATTTVVGVVELSTESDALAGTNSTKAMTPALTDEVSMINAMLFGG